MSILLEKTRIAFTGKLVSMTRREAWRLVRDLGGEPASSITHRTSILVVGMEGWPLLPNGEISHKLRRAEELRVAGCAIQIAPEPTFLEMIGRKEPSSALPKTYPAADVCRIMKIEIGTLRRWEQFGLIESRDGFYDFLDLVSIQTIHDLVRDGVRPEKIAKSLSNLAAILPGMQRPLARLRVVAENPNMLLIDRDGMRVTTTGQFQLDFEGGRHGVGGTVLSLDPQMRDLAEWFELGLGCEEEGLYREAVEAFRAVLTLDPSSSQAYCHLGNIMREMGILWAAEEFYGMATQIGPSLVTGWCGLAGAQEEQGKTEAAIASYSTALAVCPEHADGQFNLALCYEKAGRKQEARRHWFAYLKLDPAGASAQVARWHLSVHSAP